MAGAVGFTKIYPHFPTPSINLPQKPQRCLAVIVRLPDLLPPRPPIKDKRKHFIRPVPKPTPPSSNVDSNSSCTSISPPFQSPGLPKACRLVSGAPLCTAPCMVVKVISTQIFGLSALSLVPTRRGLLRGAHPLGVVP